MAGVGLANILEDSPESVAKAGRRATIHMMPLLAFLARVLGQRNRLQIRFTLPCMCLGREFQVFLEIPDLPRRRGFKQMAWL